MALFPGALAAFAGFTATHTLAADNHAAQHNLEQAEIVAVQTKVGTGASTPAVSQVLTGTGAGTSSWAQVNLATMVSGVLPVANGGNGTTSTTGTGSAVFSTSPTISGAQLTGSPTLTTPTIADFTNAVHNHQNVAGGGTLGASAITGVNSSVLFNPYKFDVYLNVSQNVSSTTVTKVLLDTKTFDTHSDFDVVTNNRFVVPVTGFYFISAQLALTAAGSTNGTGTEAYIYKNGSELLRTSIIDGNGSGTRISRPPMSRLLSLTAGDYLELFGIIDEGGRGFASGSTITFMSGFLVSTT